MTSDRGLAAGIAAFAVLVAVSVVLSAVSIRNTNELAARTTRSLCALRHDLEERVRGGVDFLLDHPRGIPGIPARTLKQSIDGQRRTIRALSDLTCR